MRNALKNYGIRIWTILGLCLVQMACNEAAETSSARSANQTTQGPKGAPGEIGPQGPTGLQGPMGPQGIAGAIQALGEIQPLPDDFRMAQLQAGEFRQWTNTTGRALMLTLGVQMYTKHTLVEAVLSLKASNSEIFNIIELYIFNAGDSTSQWHEAPVYQRTTSRIILAPGATVKIQAATNNEDLNGTDRVDIINESFYQTLN